MRKLESLIFWWGLGIFVYSDTLLPVKMHEYPNYAPDSIPKERIKMTIVPLTKEKRIDTDESFIFRIYDLDADYVFDENEVRLALMGAIHESKSALDISRITSKEDMITKRFVSVSDLEKSFPVFFKDKHEVDR